ncbi:NAD(P)H-binding protein [Streptomyces sp. SL13]|uniref:NAD(P)H-binding protein n=1 Tax=Streptantibioticus silvisoli TaxID=2705255 RepID=A0AA90H5L8_9ACTN|nr:NAD-dependent epimerase/dehydratase family protein [Streptantibioticus silvisoli]MDI5969245.1 NAD(P)H-binding protein [Streptantibioticus silvisoli]
MSRALVLGGTGLIGRAVARRLLDAGWQVDLAARDAARMPAGLAADGARFVTVDRDDPASLAGALGPGADLLVDCLCYTAAQARLLLPLLKDTACGVMISARGVYADAFGNHVNSDVAPVFTGPVPETQSTVPPGDGDYRTREGYGANKVAAEHVLLDSGLPVTVLRPSQVHGEGGDRPREWVFVKRALDRRPAVLLAHRGARPVHLTGAANLAALVETVAARPAARILNCADPDAPTGLDVVRLVAARLGHRWREVLLDGDHDGLGHHPWNTPYPLRLDMSAAEALGYVPAGDYAALAGAAIDRLAAAARPGAAGHVLPGADEEYFAPLLDYAAEDRYLAGRTP